MSSPLNKLLNEIRTFLRIHNLINLPGFVVALLNLPQNMFIRKPDGTVMCWKCANDTVFR